MIKKREGEGEWEGEEEEEEGETKKKGDESWMVKNRQIWRRKKQRWILCNKCHCLVVTAKYINK